MTGRPVPTSTLRVQLEPSFTLDDAAAVVAHAAALGVTHLYLSPVLQAGPGSRHGYDVTDHTVVAADLGGEPAWSRLVAATRRVGLGIVVDIVPNHMAVPVPERLNRPLWSVLRQGRASPYASWFDIDWAAGDDRVVLPVLGGDLDDVLAAGELGTGLLGAEQVVRYHDHVFPVAPGTAGMPLSALLPAQHYRLASWREPGAPNYRRFFDVTSLIALRVEDPAVFDATHARVVDLVRAGQVDGLRIDHPDGLADPEGYLGRLRDVTGGTWVVVEKILAGGEPLPEHWACAGTTGYDALRHVGGLFVDPDGATPLAQLATELLGAPQDLAAMTVAAKRQVVEQVLDPEVRRLLRLVARARPDLPPAAARSALEALLVAMDRYRVYVRPGEPASATAVRELQSVADRALAADPGPDPAVVAALVDLALDRPVGLDTAARRDFCVRFQQTCGPVMAKAVEDTVCYRHVRLTGLNEVGGDPGRVGVSLDEFHAYATQQARHHPHALTTLSTHDTKRSEDVRARLAVLSERPDAWAGWVRAARRMTAARRPARLDAPTEYLLWQTLVGAWPIDAGRLAAYCCKAVREAKLHTSWTDPDEEYERAVLGFAGLVATDAAVAGHVDGWLRRTARETRANVLGQKLVQLTMPGVADLYQGTELVELSLVDPDNRRPVDWAVRRDRLAGLDGGAAPADLADEKLRVTAAALRLRRECPEAFVGDEGDHTRLASDSHHVVAFARGAARAPDVVVLATRLAGRLADGGGWRDATVTLPVGRWVDLFRHGVVAGGAVRLESVLPLTGLPVALLVRDGPGVGPAAG
ncbi:malto-oligosyltrehalose synthase [Intrasporangium sp.]|uniref:malto-oligosyltrehalose synthase n=1 Tax=Intrasporangium sp. TaxID=1925024 RepID=UPI003222220C